MKPLSEVKTLLFSSHTVRAEYDALGSRFDMARELEAARARARAGLTQAEVAESMGTTQSVIARLEGGRR